MRLWHYKLIKYLPCIKTTGDRSKNQLGGQHSECCALRGNGWNKPHDTVNYVFNYSPIKLFSYHMQVVKEMNIRGFKIDLAWLNPLYRGKDCDPWLARELDIDTEPYPEHDDNYLRECIKNLQDKGIFI